MDEFPPGRSFFFVSENEPKLLVDASALDAVGCLKQSDEISSVSQHQTYVALVERRNSLVRAFPSFDS